MSALIVIINFTLLYKTSGTAKIKIKSIDMAFTVRGTGLIFKIVTLTVTVEVGTMRNGRRHVTSQDCQWPTCQTILLSSLLVDLRSYTRSNGRLNKCHFTVTIYAHSYVWSHRKCQQIHCQFVKLRYTAPWRVVHTACIAFTIANRLPICTSLYIWLFRLVCWRLSGSSSADRLQQWRCLTE